MSPVEEAHWIETMRRRTEKSRVPPGDDELTARALELSKQLFGGELIPSSVRWSDVQQQRWGSCTPGTGTIRISSRVRDFPRWVVDYVLVHELAHLRYMGHGPRFWALVGRYPLTERARGYLLAKGGEAD